MNVKKTLSGVLSMALLCDTGAAFADTLVFESGLSNVSWSTRDLAPDDGITAGYTSFARTEYSVTVNENGSRLANLREQKPELEPLDLEVKKGGTTLSLQSTGVPGDLQLSGAMKGSAFGRNVTNARIDHTIFITLTPNTELTLTGHILQSIAYLGGSSWKGGAGSTFAIEMTDLMSDFGGTDILYGYQTGLGPNGSEVINQDFTYTYANTRDTEASFYMYIFASAGLSSTAPVPEPSTYAMLAIGMMGMGMVARRQRRRI